MVILQLVQQLVHRINGLQSPMKDVLTVEQNKYRTIGG